MDGKYVNARKKTKPYLGDRFEYAVYIYRNSFRGMCCGDVEDDGIFYAFKEMGLL